MASIGDVLTWTCVDWVSRWRPAKQITAHFHRWRTFCGSFHLVENFPPLVDMPGHPNIHVSKSTLKLVIISVETQNKWLRYTYIKTFLAQSGIVTKCLYVIRMCLFSVLSLGWWRVWEDGFHLHSREGLTSLCSHWGGVGITLLDYWD